MLFHRLAAAAAVMIGLSGCASVPMGSLLELSRTDVMTTSLDQLRAAIWLPAQLRPLPGTARLTVLVQREGQGDETLDLALVSGSAEESAAFPPSNGHYFVYRLADEDIARFDAVRRDILEKRRPGSLTLGVGIREFCRTAPIPEGPLYASSYVRTSEIGAYVPLIDRFDLRSDARLAGAFENVPPC